MDFIEQEQYPPPPPPPGGPGGPGGPHGPGVPPGTGRGSGPGVPPGSRPFMGHMYLVCITLIVLSCCVCFWFCLWVFVFGFAFLRFCLIPEASIGQRRQGPGEAHCRDGGRR